MCERGRRLWPVFLGGGNAYSIIAILPVYLDNGTVLNAAKYLADRFVGIPLQQQKRYAISHFIPTTHKLNKGKDNYVADADTSLPTKSLQITDSACRPYPAPVECARKIVAGAERQNGDWRRRSDVKTVDGGQNPADSTVTAACQYPQIRHLTKHVQSIRTYSINNRSRRR